MIQDFIINVNTLTAGVSQQGFGRVLVVSNEFEIEKQVIKSIKDLKITGEDEIKNSNTEAILNTIFSQNELIDVMVIGKVTEDADEIVKLIKTYEDEDFYFITTTTGKLESIKKIAEYVGTMERMYFETITDADIENDINLDNVALFAHKDSKKKLGAGMIPIMSVRIGAKTAKFKQINGMTVSGYDATQLENLIKQNVNVYTQRKGIAYLREGVTTTGQFIDVTLAGHYVQFRLEEDLIQHFVNTDNVDYTNQGISELIDVVERRMKVAKNNGIFENYTISYAEKAEIPKAELASRRYNYLKVRGTLSGSIHGATIDIYIVL